MFYKWDWNLDISEIKKFFKSEVITEKEIKVFRDNFNEDLKWTWKKIRITFPYNHFDTSGFWIKFTYSGRLSTYEWRNIIFVTDLINCLIKVSSDRGFNPLVCRYCWHFFSLSQIKKWNIYCSQRCSWIINKKNLKNNS